MVFSSESFKCNETENCSINTCLESSIKFLRTVHFLIELEISIPVRISLTWELTYLSVHKKLILMIKVCSLDRWTAVSQKFVSLTLPLAALPSSCLAMDKCLIYIWKQAEMYENTGWVRSGMTRCTVYTPTSHHKNYWNLGWTPRNLCLLLLKKSIETDKMDAHYSTHARNNSQATQHCGWKPSR